MSLEQTWRWFGPNDPLSLAEIRQTGATGIVTALHDIPAGEIWTVDAIMERRRVIEASRLTWSVVESVSIHEEIKQMGRNASRLVENYKETIRNLASCGIDLVCYHFMPVLDWSRTELDAQLPDESVVSRFQFTAFAAFDLHVLKRKDGEKDYSDETIRSAHAYFKSLSETQKSKLVEAILLGFPGSLQSYSLDELRLAISTYQDIDEHQYREHLHGFLRDVVPVAEESGVVLALHPDDPPWSLFGLPRIVSTKHDLEQLAQVIESPANGITLCTGSLGARPDNDLDDITSSFISRVHFLHLRNVIKTGRFNFFESDHLSGDIDLHGIIRLVLLEQRRRLEEGRNDARIPFRPDHGRSTLADRMLAKQKGQDVYPGYSLFGRMRALAELRGLEAGIRLSLGL
jgi:mannonate dehydratase